MSVTMTEQIPSASAARYLLQLVQQGALDAAIEAGLMAWTPQMDEGLEQAECALLAQTCARLRMAWAARERFRARQARLERRERERRERRAAIIAPPASAAPASPALPAAAAAILARARARAGVAPQ